VKFRGLFIIARAGIVDDFPPDTDEKSDFPAKGNRKKRHFIPADPS
jgi:hypothetical protein